VPGAEERTRVYVVTACALVLLGTLLRVLGYFGGIEFWWDEASWAVRVVEDHRTSIRPLGYLWVSRWLIDLRNTEPVIRSVSLGAGVLSLPMLLAVCRQAGLSRLTSLFGLFVLAVHPAAIDLTKEFKPYALELLLHLLLLWLALSFLRSRGARRVALVGLGATLAAPFSWSIVVLYPGVFATLGLSAFRRREPRQLLAALGGAGATLAVAVGHYAQVRAGRVPSVAYWGDKYGVFHLGSGFRGLVSWLLEKTYEVASFPASLETFWLSRPVIGLFEGAQVALCLLGVIAIFRARRWDRAGLWLCPWLVTVGLNLAGTWPYGVFRTNLFLLAYSLLVSLAGLDGVRQWMAARPGLPRRAARLAVPAWCGAFVLAFFPFDLGYFAAGKGSPMAGDCHVHRAMRVIYEAERDEPTPTRPRRFVVDAHARGVLPYYSEHHVVTRERYRDFFQERYRTSMWNRPQEGVIDRQAARGFWLLACKPGPARALRQHALDRCPQVDYLEDFRFGGVLLRCPGAADRSPPAPEERGRR
jgi:hypothetical protein